MRTSEKAKVADGAATTMSAAAMMPMPPARAGPATRTRTGFGQRGDPLQDRRQLANALSAGRRDRPPPSDPCRSRKPARDGSAARTRTAGSACRHVQRGDQLVPARAADSALRLAGESRVIVATPSATASSTREPLPDPARCRIGWLGHRVLRTGSDWADCNWADI